MTSKSPTPQDNDVDPFVHSLAISLSREINLVQPNDLLAKRVIDLVRTNQDSLVTFSKAISTFGRFRDVFVADVWRDVKAHESGVHVLNPDMPVGSGSMRVGTLVVQDTDVMQPEAPKPGGLVRPGLATTGEKLIFKAPALPKASLLGLDSLAMEKRREREAAATRESKRPRLDDSTPNGRADFKGACVLHCLNWISSNK